MDMPVNSLQQALAGALDALGVYATEVWFLIGAAGSATLTGLALLPLLPVRIQQNIGKHRWIRAISSDQAFLIAMVALIIIVRLPGVTLLQLNFDDSNHTLVARTLLRDPRFWITAESQSVGPISILALMLPGFLGFPIDYTSNKVMAVLTWCGVSAAMFVGFRWLYPGPLVRVMVLPLALTAAAFNYWDYVPFNGEHMAILGLAVAFMLHARLQRDPMAVLPARAFSLGATLALIPFTKVQAAPIAVAWGIVACLHAIKHQPSRILQYVYGAGLVAILIACYLFAIGAWHDFWQSYILNNLLYAKVGWNASQEHQTLLGNFLSAPWYFMKPPDSRGMFLFAAGMFALGLAWACASEKGRRALFTWDVFISLSLVVAATFSVLLPKNNWTHYLLLLFVPVSMLTAAILNGMANEHDVRASGLRTRSRSEYAAWWNQSYLAAGLLAAVLGGFLPAVYSMLHGNPATMNPDTSLLKGQTPDVVTAAILRYASPGEPVAHWGPLYGELCAAGVILGTREAMNERAYYPSEQQDYYLDRWIQDVISRRPRVLLDSAGGAGQKYIALRLANYPKAYHEVVSRYELVEEVEGFHIYTLRETAQ